jgi:hypothetical protein
MGTLTKWSTTARTRLRRRRGNTSAEAPPPRESTARGRPSIALHRRAYLVGVLVATFIAAVAAAALIGFATDRSQASTFVERDSARGLLVAAQLDVGQGQMQLGLALPATPTAATRAALPRAVAQLQSGIAEWNRYEAVARHRNWFPAGAAELSADLVRLEAGGGPAQPSAVSAPTGLPVSQLSTMNAIARQVGVDFDVVQSGEQAWWTANLVDREPVPQSRAEGS